MTPILYIAGAFPHNDVKLMATKSKPLANSWAVRILLGGSLLILVLMPFHALLSTWAGTSFGFYLYFKAWKELLLLVLAAITIGLLIKDRALAKKIFDRKINWLILAYCVVHVLTWIIFRPNTKAAVAGMMTNLRFLVFFGIAQVVYYYRPRDFGPERLVRYVLVPFALTIGFALLQILLLPKDFLRHFGYSNATIEPFLTIDQKPDLIRYASTGRGPNQYGAYMLLPVAMLVYVFFKRKARRLILVLLPTAAVLFYTHSRSAWLGMAATLVTLCVLQLNRRQLKQVALYSLPFIAIVGVVFYGMRDTYLVQNTLFHTDENSTAAHSSNYEHWANAANAAKDAATHPIGQGPGSAGPASFYNVKGGKIAENYYIQIAQEVGILGLALFVAINVLLIKQLFPYRRHFWPAVLLASFTGVAVVNIFLHGWADDTLGLVWWGVAGAVSYVVYDKVPKPKKVT